MAAFNIHGSTGGLSYHNGGGSGEQPLPTGSCGFRDLSIGAKAPVCGCRKFWLSNNAYNGRDGAAQMAWCFCGHHACFHDAFSSENRMRQAAMGAPVSPVVTQSPARNQQPVQPSPLKPAGLGIRPGSMVPSQSINTRLWDAMNAFARGQEDGPSSGATSKLPSTACPSVGGDDQPKEDLNRMVLDRSLRMRSMGPPVSIPYGDSNAASADEYSATEVATPSIRGTPDLRPFTAPVFHTGMKPSGASIIRMSLAVHDSPGAQEALNRDVDVPRPSATAEQGPQSTAVYETGEMRNLLRSLSHRVECLESLSFNHIPAEEVELMDGRLLDLEQWRADTEHSAQVAESLPQTSANRRRLLPMENESLSSDESFDSTAGAHTEAVVLATLAATSETVPRIDALERRVTDLEQSSLPSFANPWHVQVVVLPWGRALRGIWFSALDATQRSVAESMHASEEWRGSQPAAKLSFKAAASAAWTTESIEAWADDAHGWLSPKACGPSGTVFRRLASRGLVQDVMLTASDPRHLLGAISAAFGPILDTGDDSTASDDQHQALGELFIPLRKERKSSRLRFLSPAEMVTSASWTAGFMDSSVFMKVNDGKRRLYITTPDAYVQTNHDGWSWQTLKLLPLHNASLDEQRAFSTGVAIEACWAYSGNLDQPVSATVSFAASQGSHFSLPDQHISDKMQAQEAAEDEPRPYTLPFEARPRHHRTVSLPSSTSAAEEQRVLMPKRRVASFETTGWIALHASQLPQSATSKRRRISTSPEAERRGVGFTPRMSREPPSPYTSEPVGEGQSQGNISRNRGTTPFAYATPHSNNNAGLDRMEFSGGDGDTEADTDIAMPHTDDEWQGAGDDQDTALTDQHSAMDESEIDEEGGPQWTASSAAG
ncbi:hypothetical protein LTR12_015450 [Friedmanniomyces endolithicus]|nr:hypothetical protein LTR12_015450 [Friedmanniomyces endolithicus]